MMKSSHNAQKKELAALPLARIDTMDATYTMPLREYLFTNGCQVFVNSGPTDNVTYFFVVGDSNFVKKTLAFRHDLGKKQLIICWDTEDHDSINQFIHKHTKIVYVDPIALTNSMLSDIFTFFFTARGKELHLQKQTVKNFIHTKDSFDSSTISEELSYPQDVEVEPLAPLSANEYQQVQKKRIASLITDMFGKESDKNIETNEAPKALPKVSYAVPRESSRKLLLPLILLTGILTLAPFLLYIGSIGFRMWSIVDASNNLKNGKSDVVKKSIKIARMWSGYTHSTAPLVHLCIRSISGDKMVQSLERLDRLLDVVVEVENELLTVNDAVLSMGAIMLMEETSKQPLTPVVAVDTIRKHMPSIRNKLDLAAAYLQSFNTDTGFPFSLPIVQEQRDTITNKITKFRQIAEIGERVAQIYPLFGGFRDKERVLVLLQNSSELRPTGGFIGSLAHLTVSEGSLEEMKIEDVYTLDGQLKGHIDPPTPIKELLAQEHWYLRDSNWSPDFQTTAERVLLFYEKETGESVESVVGITSSFIVRILKVIGSVDLQIFNDTITADNFYLKSLYYTQANFFPGSTQKKDFLGALMEAILIKLQKDPQSGIAIMQIIHDSLTSKDIQIYSTRPESQQALKQFGWAGSVPAGLTCLVPSNTLQCLFSYVYLNEANMSVNKVNSFIDRSQSRSVKISEDGTVEEIVTRKIQNLSQGESGTGTYTAYMRIYVPTESTLTGITLDGLPIPMRDTKITKQTLPYGEIDSTIAGITGIGVAFEVAPGRERMLSASILHTQTLLKESKEGMLTLFEQKQAGVDQIPTITTLSYPPTWLSTQIPSPSISRVVAKPGYLEYNTMLSEDTEYSVHFIR